MQESTSYAVGLDIGTTKVRAIVAHVDSSTGVPTVVGIGQAANTGMRKRGSSKSSGSSPSN